MSLAWPFVNRVGNTTATGGSTTAAVAQSHTTGNQIVVGVIYQSSGTVTSVTDTASNTYTQCGTQVTDGGSNKLQLWRAWNITGNASNVVTAHLGTGTFTFAALDVYQLTMVGTSDPLQNTAGTNGTGVTASSGTVTVTGDAAIIGIAILNAGGTVGGVSGTLDSPFWTVNAASTSGQFLGAGFKLSSTSAAIQIAQTSSATWGLLAGAFTIPGLSSGGGGAFAHA